MLPDLENSDAAAVSAAVECSPKDAGCLVLICTVLPRRLKAHGEALELQLWKF